MSLRCYNGSSVVGFMANSTANSITSRAVFPMTLAGWAKFDATGDSASVKGTVISYQTDRDDNTKLVGLSMRSADRKLSGIIAESGGVTYSSAYPATTATHTGGWHLLVAVFNGTDATCTSVDQYIWRPGQSLPSADANLRATGSTFAGSGDAIVGALDNIGLGGQRNSATGAADLVWGKVAHCAVWLDTLTSTQIDNLTTYTPNGIGKAPDLYWPLLTDGVATYGGVDVVSVGTGNADFVADDPSVTAGASAVAPLAAAYYAMS